MNPIKPIMAAGVAVALLLTACEKEIDFDYKEIDPILVIEGELSTSGASVRLTYTTPMAEPIDTTAVTDASVTITDTADDTPMELTADSTGIFRSDARGIAGHTYRLTVIHRGNTFSSSTVMTGPTEITDLAFSWIKMPYDEVAVLQISFTDNAADRGDCYWVRVYRNGLPYRWSMVKDNLAENGIINEVIMTTRRDISQEDDDDLLLDGDTVAVSVNPITTEMYNYLVAISSDTSGPAMFSGAMSLGYFMASPGSHGAIVFCPDDFSASKPIIGPSAASRAAFRHAPQR